MQELRLVGVHEDGHHLLLSSEQGVSFRLPIDDALRRASEPSADRQPPAARPLPEKPRTRPARPTVQLTPRDIQARIRSGASAEQVAEESGLDLAHVQRYEGPVRAERDYVAYLAQRVEVATPLPSHDGYRSAFGDDPALLGDMVAFRLQEFGVDPSELEWDSWRRPDGSWHVEAVFELPDDSAVDLGEQPPARWSYNPTRKTVTNANRWAQVLSELEPLDGPLPARRLSAVADHVFDFEADGPTDATMSSDADQDGLLDVLRSRRGQRLGADEEGDDALAELLTRGSIPAAHPRDADDGDDVVAPGLSLAPAPPGQDDADPEDGLNDDGTPKLYDGVSTETREISIFAHPARRSQPAMPAQPHTPAQPAPAQPAPGQQDADEQDRGTAQQEPAAGEGAGRQARDARKGSAKGQGKDQGKDQGKAASRDGFEPAGDRRPKPKRSSVPSWDDIVFGRKGD